MSTETGTQQGGGAAAPASDTSTTSTAAAPVSAKAPRSDAEAEQQERETKAEAVDKAKPEGEGDTKPEDVEGEEKKKNRTREYINKINRENAEMRRRLAELESGSPASKSAAAQAKAEPEKEPTLADFDFDPQAFQRAHSAWAVRQELEARETRAKQEQSETKLRETWQSYDERTAAFAEDHPDFVEVVGSIPYPLPMEAQLAIAAHERGPEIAYHLGNNEDDAFNLAGTRPELAAAAVERLAKRLGAASSRTDPRSEAGVAPLAGSSEPPAPKPKPISQAPAPAPRVGGRAPTEVPPEKMTDDDWYRAERERRRKR